MANQYSKLSDFEINKLVSEHQGGYYGQVGSWLPGGVKVREPDGFGYTERNYCSKDADCMPLAWGSGMDITWISESNEWDASTPAGNSTNGVRFSNDAPSRIIWRIIEMGIRVFRKTGFPPRICGLISICSNICINKFTIYVNWLCRNKSI